MVSWALTVELTLSSMTRISVSLQQVARISSSRLSWSWSSVVLGLKLFMLKEFCRSTILLWRVMQRLSLPGFRKPEDPDQYTLFRDIGFLLQDRNAAIIRYVYREANSMADWIAFSSLITRALFYRPWSILSYHDIVLSDFLSYIHVKLIIWMEQFIKRIIIIQG